MFGIAGEGGEVGGNPASGSHRDPAGIQCKRVPCLRNSSLPPVPTQCYFLRGGEKLNPFIVPLSVLLQVKVVVLCPLSSSGDLPVMALPVLWWTGAMKSSRKSK